jgi:hypothetical protein
LGRPWRSSATLKIRPDPSPTSINNEIGCNC